MKKKNSKLKNLRDDNVILNSKLYFPLINYILVSFQKKETFLRLLANRKK